MPVTDLDGQPERGQRRDPAQAGQAPGHGRELAVRGQLGDHRIAPVSTSQSVDNRVVTVIEGGQCSDPTGGQVLLAGPA